MTARRKASRFLGPACLALALAVAAPAARAEAGAVEEGHRLLQEADFEGALAAFEQAEASGGLDRDALVRMLEGRVLAHHGLGHRGALERALAALAALDPEHRFGPEVPPEVAERFAQIAEGTGGPLSVRVTLLRGEEGHVLMARPLRAPEGLVRRVRLLARVGEEGAWREGEGTLDLPGLAEGDEVAFLVELLGPGGAVMLREEGVRRVGAGGEPLPAPAEPEASPGAEPGAADPLAPAPRHPREEASGGSAGLWIGIGVGAAVVVGGVVAALLLTGGDAGSRQTLPGRPIVEGF